MSLLQVVLQAAQPTDSLTQKLLDQGALGIVLVIFILAIWKGIWPAWRATVEKTNARFDELHEEMRKDLVAERQETREARKDLMDKTFGLIEDFREVSHETTTVLKTLVKHSEEHGEHLKAIRSRIDSGWPPK